MRLCARTRWHDRSARTLAGLLLRLSMRSSHSCGHVQLNYMRRHGYSESRSVPCELRFQLEVPHALMQLGLRREIGLRSTDRRQWPTPTQLAWQRKIRHTYVWRSPILFWLLGTGQAVLQSSRRKHGRRTSHMASPSQSNGRWPVRKVSTGPQHPVLH